MKKTFLITGLGLILSGASLAGSFDGPYAQLAVGIVNNQNKVQHTGTDHGGWKEDWQSLSSNNAGGQIAIGYSYNPTGIFNIGANLFYDATSKNSGQYTYSQPGWDYSIHSKLKNVWGFSVEPGAYLSDKTLGYVKLGWVNGKSSVKVTDAGFQVNSSSSTNGVLYGIGVKQMLTNNLFIGLELSQSSFNRKSETIASPAGGADTETITTKPTQTKSFVTVGYKF